MIHGWEGEFHTAALTGTQLCSSCKCEAQVKMLFPGSQKEAVASAGDRISGWERSPVETGFAHHTSPCRLVMLSIFPYSS